MCVFQHHCFTLFSSCSCSDRATTITQLEDRLHQAADSSDKLAKEKEKALEQIKRMETALNREKEKNKAFEEVCCHSV